MNISGIWTQLETEGATQGRVAAASMRSRALISIW